ncbi:MAG TPA: hypothetical protein VD704_01240 [Gaiellaceae bacterium]|nr:hypothetical protein [Gaiellaceae bacterium]
MKAGLPLMAYLSVTQFETRRRMLEAEREVVLARRRAVVHPVERRPRRARRLLRAVRGAATA